MQSRIGLNNLVPFKLFFKTVMTINCFEDSHARLVLDANQLHKLCVVISVCITLKPESLNMHAQMSKLDAQNFS